MARKPRVAPDFSPAEMEQFESIKRKVLDSYESKSAPKPLEPQPGGMGMQGGKAGGFWYKRGGKVDKNPFAVGGPMLPRK